MKKLFVVGCPRSGTTMVQQALNRHSRITIPSETAYFSMFLGPMGHTWRTQRLFLRRINADLGIDVAMPLGRVRGVEAARAFFEQIASAYLAKIDKRDLAYFGDKTPQHLLSLPKIVEHYPDARIIVVYRDGRDVALSLSKVPWGPRDIYASFRLWLRYVKAQEQAQRRKDLSLLCVRYEEVAVEPERELRRVTDFLELPYEPQLAEGAGNRDGVASREFDWKGRALEKITRARVGNWQSELTANQVRDLERWGGAALRSLGYRVDTPESAFLAVGVPLYAAWRTFRWKLRRLFGVTRSLARLPKPPESAPTTVRPR
jgi:hypothetical protein